MKKNLSRILCVLLAVLFVFAGCTSAPIEDTTTTTTQVTTTEVPVVVSDEVKELAQDTKEDVKEGEEIATPTIPQKIDEDALENEEALEIDGIVEIENVSYDGTNTGKGTSLLGKCTGLTYYSQSDTRWKNIPYTIKPGSGQTIGSSGCGPTSAAMVVSSAKGAILPTTMAKLFVDNGYRTKNSGTAWAAWAFVADYFDFQEYYVTANYDTALKYLKKGKYYIVASCNPGLFTSAGHYIVLRKYEDGKVKVYDPAMYWGKYSTASRKGAGAVVNGKTVEVTEAKFKQYANVKQFWIFSNDRLMKQEEQKTTAEPTTQSTTKPQPKPEPAKTYTRYVTNISTSLNVRKGPGTQYSIVGSLKNKAKVTVYEVSGTWSRIGTNRWVATKYLTSKAPTTVKPTVTYKTTVGKLYRLKADTTLNTQGDFKGTNCHYYALTQCEILKHYSATVDKVKIVKTGKIRYVKVKDFKY